MARLADRILSSCHPASTRFLLSPTERQTVVQNTKKWLSKERPELTEHEIILLARQLEPSYDRPAAKTVSPKELLAGAPIFCADDVGEYAFHLPRGTDMVDIVSTMAPPFDKFFIEFQNVSNPYELFAWGTVVEAYETATTWSEKQKQESLDRDGAVPRWILEFSTFLEYEKGHPAGPMANSLAGLAEDGTWFRHSDGDAYWGGSYVEFKDGPPEETRKEYGDFIAQLLFPVLLTISFLNCRNVEVREIQPPEKLSRKHTKKTGVPLVRYNVLDIAPIKKAIESQRESTQDGFAKALHLCRGHFKTFTPDAPLLGKHAGTFWWAPQVRGKQSEGVVIKDYRVAAPSPVGRTYRDANESPSYSPSETPNGVDPDSMGRGLTGHNRTQNAMADAVRRKGWSPLSPKEGDPQYDIAWKVGDALFVCEVKSLTEKNEESQLRMATGQVIRYRQKLASQGHEPVFAVIAVESAPLDPSWDVHLEREGITLIWPEATEERLDRLRRFLH